jgi:hypothetical protein
LAVYGPSEEGLSQGDIISSVSFYSRQDHGPGTLVAVPGLVLSHSCDIDKFDEMKAKLDGNTQKRWPVQMLPLLTTADIDKGALGDVRAGRHRRYFGDLWSSAPRILGRITC